MASTAVCKPLSAHELVENFPTYYPSNAKELQEFKENNKVTFEKLNSHIISESDDIVQSLNSQTTLYQASKSTLDGNKSIISSVQSQTQDQSKEEEFFSKQRYKILQKEKTKTESEVAQFEQQLKLVQERLNQEEKQQKLLEQQIRQIYSDSFYNINSSISHKTSEIYSINSQISETDKQIFQSQHMIKCLNSNISQIDSCIQQSNNNISRYKGYIQELNNSIYTLQNEISNLQYQISNLPNNNPQRTIILQTLNQIKNCKFGDAINSFRQIQDISYWHNQTILEYLEYLKNYENQCKVDYQLKHFAYTCQSSILPDHISVQAGCQSCNQKYESTIRIISHDYLHKGREQLQQQIEFKQNWTKLNEQEQKSNQNTIQNIQNTIQNQQNDINNERQELLKLQNNMQIQQNQQLNQKTSLNARNNELAILNSARNQIQTFDQNQSRINQIIGEKTSLNNQIILKRNDALNKINQQLQQWEKDNHLRTQNKLNNQLLNQIKVNIGEIQDMFEISINELSSDTGADIDLMQLLHDSVKEEFQNKLITYK